METKHIKIKDGYIIHENCNEFILCKIVSKHKTEDEAVEALMERLLENNKEE